MRSIEASGVICVTQQAAGFPDQLPALIAVERGAAWPVLREMPAAPVWAWIDPLLDEPVDLLTARVVDRSGHARTVYPGLLAYALLQALRASDHVLLDNRAESAVRLIEHLAAEVKDGVNEMKQATIPGNRAEAVVELAWKALALFTGGELLHDERIMAGAGRAVRAIVTCQQSAGPYFLPSHRDNPETLWLAELQTLHAVASFGLQSKDPVAIASASLAAAYHQEETQPDHASGQPWGLPAFLISPQTHLMADGLLHAAAVEQPAGLSGVSLILIADALYSWRRR